jgi:hypothetical protein
MLVCRSPEAARSNGTVVLTWNNVAAGYDLFGADRRELFEGGYARVEKVGLQVQLAGGELRRAEIHWYEAAGIGRLDFKIRRFIDIQ